MRMVTMYCDRCHEPYRTNVKAVQIETHAPLRYGRRYDLCPPCHKALESWMVVEGAPPLPGDDADRAIVPDDMP